MSVYHSSNATTRKNNKITYKMMKSLSLNFHSIILYYNFTLKQAEKNEFSVISIGSSLNGYKDITTNHKSIFFFKYNYFL